MSCAAFLDLSLKIFTYASNNGKRRIAHDLPAYRAANRGGIASCAAFIWASIPLPAIGKPIWYTIGTPNLGPISPSWVRNPSFGASVPVFSSKNKEIFGAGLTFGKGGFVCFCYSAAVYAPLGSFDHQYSRAFVEWKCRFCLSIYGDARILFFGEALSGSNGTFDEVEKRRPGTSN